MLCSFDCHPSIISNPTLLLPIHPTSKLAGILGFLINLSEKFDLFSEQWRPKIVGELNDAHVKLAKLQGEFVWHQHENEDEMFMIHKGRLLIKFRDKDVWLDKGEFLIIPKGIEHKPVAEEEVELILIEPKTTVNTGDTQSERTIEAEWL